MTGLTERDSLRTEVPAVASAGNASLGTGQANMGSRSVNPDPKPRKRHRASKEEWADMHLVFRGSRCRVCRWRAGTELHHILSRRQSGDDVVINLAPLCPECHRRITDNDPFALAALRSKLNPANLSYLQERLGERWEAWLDRKLPEMMV